ncbi:hypothetical protein PR048_014949 [Dryococelus australis]|uniref:Uncharacterized protein n=1 Tax=Dryococelus australis TaxID=614101 RepID=A0ABQ9HFK3_9NEOP|nr:hypothetical protein PR048_014949 [Dryococelus australis]
MLISISGYIVHNDYINKYGSGTIYVRDNIKHKILSSSPSEYAGKPEFIIIELTISSNKVLLALRAPHYYGRLQYKPSNTNYANKLLTTLSCMTIAVCPLGATHHTA